MSGVNRIGIALLQYGPRMLLNTLAVGIAIIVILLCGMRIYGFITFFLNSSPRLDFFSGLSVYFITGSLFAYLVMMTIGVMGMYFPFFILFTAGAVVFFPYRFNIFFNDLKEFIRQFRKGSGLDFHLFGSALVFMGLPLLLLQLTNMAPPWIDILEVYVAPVERILNFGCYVPHDALPCAFYNSSRSVPLFTAFYSYIAALTGLHAGEAIVASSIYILFFSLSAVYFTANSLGAAPCGGIAVWLFSLCINFLNLPHGRSGVLIMLFFIPAVAFFVRLLSADTRKEKMLYAVITGLALGGSSLTHPLIGVYSFLLFGFVSMLTAIWIRPRFLYWSAHMLLIAGFISSCLLFNIRELMHFSLLATSLIWLGLGILASLGLYLLHLWYKKRQQPECLSKLSGIWIPVTVLVLALFIITLFPWKFYWLNETPMNLLFKQLPFFIIAGGMALVHLIYILWKNRTTAHIILKPGISLLFIAGGFLLLALPLYILPLFRIESSVGASLCQELPSKAIFYWLNPLLVIFGSLVVMNLQKKLIKDLSVLILLILIIIPVFSFLPKNFFTDDARICWVSVARGQLDVAADGYFHGWGDSRKVLSEDDYQLIDYLKGLINSGKLKMNDTIYHIAEEQHPWIAIPFPAFIGIRQTLVLVQRDPGDINTKWGRIIDFPEDFHFDAPEKWVLAEKNVIGEFPAFFEQFRRMYTVLFENKRLILFKLSNR